MKTDLITVIENSDRVQVVSARDLYDGLQITRRFSLWVVDNFKDFEEGTDYEGVLKSTPFNPLKPDGKQQQIQDYALTIEMAKELSMMSHTDLGKQYRRYFIEIERKWNDPAEVVRRGYAILQDENKQLKIENATLQPKALFTDMIEVSKNSILIRQFAKLLRQKGLEIGQNRLFEWFRNGGWLIKGASDRNAPTQKAMEMGLFEVKETPIWHKTGECTIQTTTKITGKGQIFFMKKLMKEFKGVTE